MGLKFFDLFAGIGGFRLGMERAGHECIGSCEWDVHSRETYNKNFGLYPEYDDVKDLHPQSLPSFDVLCAGFPCQAFSIAGKRLGFEDPRGNVFFEIARIAKDKRPSYLFLENVKGLLSHEKGDTFKTILTTLDEMGYDAEWQLLNSKYFVPQNRERIFIIGHLRGKRTRQVFPLGDYNEPLPKKRLTQIGTVGDSQAQRVYTTDMSCSLKAEGGGQGAKTGLYAITNNHGEMRELDRVSCLYANYHKGYDKHGARTLIAWSKSTRDWGVESRIKLGEANTLNTGDGCRTQSSQNFVTINTANIRKLTPLECERLQGFPDNWTEGVSDTQRYRQCGNAVTVPVVEYIAKELRLG